jgi:hypothetical protein
MVNFEVKESKRLMALGQILQLLWNCSPSGQGFISAAYWMCKIESAHHLSKAIGLLLLLEFTITEGQRASL